MQQQYQVDLSGNIINQYQGDMQQQYQVDLSGNIINQYITNQGQYSGQQANLQPTLQYPHQDSVLLVEDDDANMSKKRSREEAAAKEAEDKKNRGNYRCSKCNLPKKGHVCPYQPRFRKRDQSADLKATEQEIQCEIDPYMTLRNLDLAIQGLPESYTTNLYFLQKLQTQQYEYLQQQQQQQQQPAEIQSGNAQFQQRQPELHLEQQTQELEKQDK
jgi:hypothetical protein